MSTPHEAPHAVQTLRTVTNRIAIVLGALAGLGILAMMIGTAVDVVRREATGQSIAGVNEISEVLLVVVVFLGVMGAQTSGTQISTPVVTNRLPSRWGHLVRTIAGVIATLIALWAAWETTKTGITSWQAKEFRFGLAHIPVWPAKLIIPLGFYALALALITDLAEHAAKFVRRAPRETTEYSDL